MIPKIIHYCWLSGEPMPQKLVDCIETWRVLMPDYEIMCWDSKRFDISSVKWVEQACSIQKWAFAADYIRLYAIYHHGGIYLDSDIRMLKSFDPMLCHRGFSGTEYYERATKLAKHNYGINIEAAVIGAEKHHPMIKDFMDYYHDRDFIRPGDVLSAAVMPLILSHIATRHGFVYDINAHQILDGDFHIYPYDYFVGQNSRQDCPVTYNTVAIHMTYGSWRPQGRNSIYTIWRRLTVQYWKDFWRDVVMSMATPHKRGKYHFDNRFIE